MKFHKESEWENRYKPHTELPLEMDTKYKRKHLIVGVGVAVGVATFIHLLVGRK